MTLKIDHIVSSWEIDEPKYARLGKHVVKSLKDLVYEIEIYPEINYRIKDLLSIIRKLKKKNLTKKYSYDDLPDKLGIRVICSFVEEMEELDKVICDNFTVVKVEKKKDALDHDRLDYISNHYDLSVDCSKKPFKRLEAYKHLIFELQIKTLNQHTWSNTSHALSYKQEAKLSDVFKRKIFRLLSLYEIADDEFSIVNNALKNDPENFPYTILRKTEGKIYKFAKVDFDREYSLYALDKLLGYFNLEQKNQISKDIESFITLHSDKIRKIFMENRNRFYQLTFLTQPEIFIVWYALEKFSFSITDNWANDFDPHELEQIQTLWGKEI